MLKNLFKGKDEQGKQKAEPEKTEEIKSEVPTNESETQEIKNNESDKPEIKEEQEPENDIKASDEQAVPIQSTEVAGNGLNIQDLVTKDDLNVRFSALEAKLDAIIQENTDLKNQNDDLKEKYENPNFGTTVRKGTIESDKKVSQYQSFEDYSKNFR